ncbi:hypothetical protein LXL04_020174 [Taraxacum kok-saghyz]
MSTTVKPPPGPGLLFVPVFTRLGCRFCQNFNLIEFYQCFDRGLHEEMRQFPTLLSINQFPDRGAATMAARSSLTACTSIAINGYKGKRALLPIKKLRSSLLANSKLHRTLYGFIVFQVMWKDVRGINYLNELQTDTSLAIEAKYMKRWEFDSIS